MNQARPWLAATLYSDAGSNANLRARFDVYQGSSQVWTGTTSTDVPSGTTVEIPTRELEEGPVYGFRVRTHAKSADGTVVSPWTSWCYFQVDLTPPPEPVVTSEDYPDSGSAGGPGVPGTFTFASDAPDVIEYQYLYGGDLRVVEPDSPDGSATVELVPETFGLNILQVYAVDAAGWRSATSTYYFFVARPSGPSRVYRFDATEGTSVPDDCGCDSPQPLTVHGAGSSPGWSELARLGGSLRLDGRDDYASTEAPAVSTKQSFSISAWVRLDSTGSNMSVARQANADGLHGLLLYYSKSHDRWGFQRDTASGTPDTAYSKVPPAVGVWTHLAGVYDASQGRLRLYVNGQLQATTAHSSAWETTQPLEFGRWEDPGVQSEAFDGQIDEVRIWDRAVLGDQLFDYINFPEPELVGHWTFDGSGADSSGYGHTAHLNTLGASLVTDADGKQVLRVDSTSQGYARTRGAVVDGTGSFTITAWVKPAGPEHVGAVVGQGSSGNNAKDTFDLGLARSNPSRWQFVRTSQPSNDPDAGQATALARSEMSAEDYGNEWVHLTAVYDSARSRIQLYVDGAPQVEGVVFTDPWHSAQHVMFGREWAGADVDDSFAGDIDEIRMYAGVMNDYQVCELAGCWPEAW